MGRFFVGDTHVEADPFLRYVTNLHLERPSNRISRRIHKMRRSYPAYVNPFLATAVKFCIPMIQTTDSEGRRPPIPIEGGHLFRVNPATLPNRKQC